MYLSEIHRTVLQHIDARYFLMYNTSHILTEQIHRRTVNLLWIPASFLITSVFTRTGDISHYRSREPRQQCELVFRATFGVVNFLDSQLESIRIIQNGVHRNNFHTCITQVNFE
ncbi:hypothetical protein CBL_12235 [Carabus blaptoides fortunei]